MGWKEIHGKSAKRLKKMFRDKSVYPDLLRQLGEAVPLADGWEYVSAHLRSRPTELMRPDLLIYPELEPDLVAGNLYRVTVGEKMGTMFTSPVEAVAELPGAGRALEGWEWTLTCFLQHREVQGEQEELPDDVRDKLKAGATPLVALEALRTELAEAQRRHPPLAEVAKVLEGKQAKEIGADRTAFFKAQGRAREYILAKDGVLLRLGIPGAPEGVPEAPPVALGPTVAAVARLDQSRTWQDFFVAMAHEPIPGLHQPDGDRLVESLQGVGWWEGMRASADKWCQACRICASRNRTGRISTPLRSLGSMRPFTSLTWDLVFISPKGNGGEVGCLSAICTYTKYVWLRTIRSKHARAVAWALLAVIADAGVFPMRLGNDREKSFRTKVVEELTALCNSRMSFGLAYTPWGHGDVERMHRDLHRFLNGLVASMAGMQMADWPLGIPLAELAARQKIEVDGVTPYALTHGWASTTPMTTTLQTLTGIPEGLETTTWMKGARAVARMLCDKVDAYREDQKAIAAVRKSQLVRPRTFDAGDTVLLQRPPDVSAGRHLRPLSTGIWRIQSIDSAGGSAILEDAASGRTKLDDFGEPDRVSTHRLVRYMPKWDPVVEEEKLHSLGKLVAGDLVSLVHEGEILLARVEEVRDNQKIKGQLLRVPVQERHGGWSRRPWKEIEGQKEFAWDTLLGRVALGQTECLTPESLQWVSKWAGVDLM